MKHSKPKKRGPEPERLVIEPSHMERVLDRLLDKRPVRAPHAPDAPRTETGRPKAKRKKAGQ